MDIDFVFSIGAFVISLAALCVSIVSLYCAKPLAKGGEKQQCDTCPRKFRF